MRILLNNGKSDNDFGFTDAYGNPLQVGFKVHYIGDGGFPVKMKVSKIDARGVRILPLDHHLSVAGKIVDHRKLIHFV